jgi:hypothetical protein
VDDDPASVLLGLRRVVEGALQGVFEDAAQAAALVGEA